MSSKTEKKAVPAPQLRFPGFEGEWEEKPLFSLVSVITRKAGTEKHTPMSITSGVGLVSQVEKFGKDIAGAQYKNYFVIQKYDFAYNKSSTKDYPEGFIAMHTAEATGAVPNSIFTCFRTKTEKSVPEYLNYLFQTNLHGKWLRKFITVGARANGALNVDTADLMATPVPVPTGSQSLPEQQHIAACLTSLDALITAQTNKLTALRQHKQGLMQQLFPAEGEKVPRLRFPEFEGAGEWEEKRLGEVCTRIMDGTHFSPKTQSGAFMYLTSKNIRNGYIDLSNVSYISEEEHRVIYARCPVVLGDVLLTKDGANTGNCAINSVAEEFSLLSSVAVIRGKRSFMLQDFIFQSILSDTFQKGIQDAVSGQAITRITLEKLSNMIFIFPSLTEQTRIASFLSSIDELITAQADKIAALQTFKRGLMQGLFPAAGAQ